MITYHLTFQEVIFGLWMTLEDKLPKGKCEVGQNGIFAFVVNFF
jgi:hypothetical protein